MITCTFRTPIVSWVPKQTPNHLHDASIDPHDHSQGKTIRTGCMVHYNLVAIHGTGMWMLSFATYQHNHDRTLAVGARAPQPVSKLQRRLIETYATKPSFSHEHVKSLLSEEFPNNHLDSRQISNVINAARTCACQDIKQLGGDFAAIINDIQAKIAHGETWTYNLKLDDSSKVIGLWWQSPEQAALTHRYSDILINDNAANRNQYSYPINVGVVIDNFANSRNIWYALQACEDAAMHTWVLCNHLEVTGSHPEVFISDRDPALLSVVPKVMPFTHQLYCLHHLEGNIAHALQPILRSVWDRFKQDFWAVYRSVSPDAFQTSWHELEEKYLQAKAYDTYRIFFSVVYTGHTLGHPNGSQLECAPMAVLKVRIVSIRPLEDPNRLHMTYTAYSICEHRVRHRKRQCECVR